MLHPLRDEEWRLARLERLGLKEDPFKLSADPRYLYLGPEHLAVYRQAQGVISRRRGLALITGDMGMGKSSLARRLYDVYASEDMLYICYIHTAAFKSAMDAARQISASFDLPPSAASSARWTAWNADGRRLHLRAQCGNFTRRCPIDVHRSPGSDPPPVQFRLRRQGGADPGLRAERK